MDQSMARQLRRIREGMAPAEAYDLELQVPHDPGTESLLEAMGALYRLIASRNEALEQLNANLEEQVQFRTRELTTSNEQLKVEQNSLHLAMQQLEMTQRKLLESEHRRAAATRRNMESMLAQIIDNDPVPTFVIDAQHRLTHWNKACESITGVKAADMIGTQNHQKVFYPPDVRPVMADLIVNGSLEEQFDQFYHRNFRRSPTIPRRIRKPRRFSRIWPMAAGCISPPPLLNDQGECIGAIETCRTSLTATSPRNGCWRTRTSWNRWSRNARRSWPRPTRNWVDRKALEELLARVEEAQQQLLQSEKMAAIGQLAAGVAHEINNPVGFVNSNLGTLKTYIGQLFGVIEAYEAAAAGGDPARSRPPEGRSRFPARRPAVTARRVAGGPGPGHQDRPGPEGFLAGGSGRIPAGRPQHRAGKHPERGVERGEVQGRGDSRTGRHSGSGMRAGTDQPGVHEPAGQRRRPSKRVAASRFAPVRPWPYLVRGGRYRQGHDARDMQAHLRAFFTTKPVGKGTGLGLSISYDIIVKKHRGRFDVTSTPAKVRPSSSGCPSRGRKKRHKPGWLAAGHELGSKRPPPKFSRPICHASEIFRCVKIFPGHRKCFESFLIVVFSGFFAMTNANTRRGRNTVYSQDIVSTH
jgi:PAS domain S-box-containing protein